MARTESRRLPLGGSIESWAQDWQIRSIRVDNPSGYWLLVYPLGEYVPPFTSGWSRVFSPSTLTVTIRSSIKSPSGSLSQAVGTDATVTIYDEEIAPSEGIGNVPTGSGARVATVPPSITESLPFATGATGAIIAPVANRSIVLRRLVLVPDLNQGLAGPVPYRNMITARFLSSTGGQFLYALAISPEHPFAEASFEDGTLILARGVGLSVVGQSESSVIIPYVGTAYFIVMAQYYLQD